AGFHPAILKPNAVPAPRARGIRFAIDPEPGIIGDRDMSGRFARQHGEAPDQELSCRARD
ncbi:MAG: hypothetical protein VB131_07180, partial [Burkholderia gladioli]